MSAIRIFFRSLIVAGVGIGLLASAANAQNAAGQAGAQLGKQVIDGAAMPTYDNDAGRGAGTFTMGGVTIDTAELAPGATTETIKGIAKAPKAMTELEDQGISTFNSTVSAEGAQGEAARAMMSSQAMSTEEALGGDPSMLERMETQYLNADPLGDAFKDCKTTTTSGAGQDIVTRSSQDYTCNVGRVGASCTREREITLEPNEDVYDPGACRDGSCERELWKLHDSVSFNGTCEADVKDNSCRATWTCTDSAPRSINGVLIDSDYAVRHKLEPLYPGAPALCWAAAMKVECPICNEDENGVQSNCTYVDISQGEGDTCGAYQSNAMCRPVGETCLLNDVDGSCAVLSRRYTCDKPVVVKSNEVRSTNTCAGSIQCLDGSCNAGVDFNEQGGMSLQQAMARMVVSDTLAADITRDATTIAQSDGQYSGLGAADTAQEGGHTTQNWGYDQTDRGGAEAPPENQLTAAQQEMMNQAQLFKGEAFSCQSSFGGMIDCCKATDGGAKKLFWEINAEINRNNQAGRMAGQGGQSGYALMQQGNASLGTLSNPFTSMRDNVMGGSGVNSIQTTTLTVWQQFMQRARAEIKPALSPKWACSDKEFDLAVQREVDMCSYAGTYCSKKVLGVCMKKREAYCCFKSPMSRMLRASAEPGGKINHGNPKKPDCSGVPIDEIDRIDWDSMDFNQLAGNMDQGGAFDKTKDPSNASRNFSGSGASAVSTGRQNVEDRTADRIAGIDTDAVKAGIAADAQSRRATTTITVAPGPAKLAFSNTYAMVSAGQPAAVTVGRTGSSGQAAAVVTVIEGSVEVAGFYTATLTWGDGDTSSKTIRLNPPAGASGRVVLELRATAGSVTAPNMTIDIR